MIDLKRETWALICFPKSQSVVSVILFSKNPGGLRNCEYFYYWLRNCFSLELMVVSRATSCCLTRVFWMVFGRVPSRTDPNTWVFGSGSSPVGFRVVNAGFRSYFSRGRPFKSWTFPVRYLWSLDPLVSTWSIIVRCLIKLFLKILGSLVDYPPRGCVHCRSNFLGIESVSFSFLCFLWGGLGRGSRL